MVDKGLDETGVDVAALVPDLLFAARIRGAAPAARTVHSSDQLAEVVGPGTRLVLVDLQARGAVDAIRMLREREDPPRIVAYGPHVAGEVLTAARAAGADRVLARGAFVAELPSIVKEGRTGDG